MGGASSLNCYQLRAPLSSRFFLRMTFGQHLPYFDLPRTVMLVHPISVIVSCVHKQAQIPSFVTPRCNLDLTRPRRKLRFFSVRSRTQITRSIFSLGAILVCPDENGDMCRDVVLAVKRTRGKCTELSVMEAHRKFRCLVSWEFL
jgi:hypothetical protein